MSHFVQNGHDAASAGRRRSPTHPLPGSLYLRHAIDTLLRDAPYFLSIVTAAVDASASNSPIKEAASGSAVLRVSFAIDADGRTLRLRRVAPLFLWALSPDYAWHLTQLCNTVSSSSQFVAWLTVDGPPGQVEPYHHHTCAVIDAVARRTLWEGPVHAPDGRSRSACNRVPSTEAGASFFVGMAQARSTPHIWEQPVPSLADNELAQAMHPSRPRDPAVPFHASALPDQGRYDVANAESAAASPRHSAIHQRLEDVLTVALLCAKASSKLTVGLDDVQSRLDALVDMVQPLVAAPLPQDVGRAVLTEVMVLSNRLAVLEDYIQHSAPVRKVTTSDSKSVQVSLGGRHAETQTEAFDLAVNVAAAAGPLVRDSSARDVAVIAPRFVSDERDAASVLARETNNGDGHPGPNALPTVRAAGIPALVGSPPSSPRALPKPGLASSPKAASPSGKGAVKLPLKPPSS